MWKIEKTVSKGDYNYAIVRDHPYASKYGYVLYHRIVVENFFGRLLEKDEIVHHINGDKKDNRIENLEVMKAKDHAALHGKERKKKFARIKCPNCKKEFVTRLNNTFISRKCLYTTCSRHCNGKFSTYLIKNRDSEEVLLALSENLIEIFT